MADNQRFNKLASAPAGPTEGEFYYDTVLHAFGFYNGSAWVYGSATAWGPGDTDFAAIDGNLTLGGHPVSAAGATTGQALCWNGTDWVPETVAGGGGGGTVDSVVAGTDINVDATDPANPVVSVPASTFDDYGLSATETSRAEAAEALLAPLASAALTGSPTAPTKTALTDNTDIATTAYTDAAVGVETSRAETAEALLAPKASPALTGVPTAPTATALTDDTQLATTAYADTAVGVEKTRALAAEGLLAPLASPALTGTPTAPTRTALTDNTDIATTAYADAAVAVELSRAETAEASNLPLAGGTMSGPIAMGSHKVTGLTNGSSAQDAAAFGQIPTTMAAHVFKATSASQAMPSNSDYHLSKVGSINTSVYDTDSAYDTTNSRYTAKKAGYWLITVVCGMTSAGTDYVGTALPFVDVAPALNGIASLGGLTGTGLGARQGYASGDYGAQFVGSDLYYMNGSTDYVELFSNSQPAANTARYAIYGVFVGT